MLVVTFEPLVSHLPDDVGLPLCGAMDAPASDVLPVTCPDCLVLAASGWGGVGSDPFGLPGTLDPSTTIGRIVAGTALDLPGYPDLPGEEDDG